MMVVEAVVGVAASAVAAVVGFFTGKRGRAASAAKVEAEATKVEAEVTLTMTDVARQLMAEQRQLYEHEIEILKTEVDILRARVSETERHLCRVEAWAEMLIKQVSELGGDPPAMPTMSTRRDAE